MYLCELTKEEALHRKQISDGTRKMICGVLNIIAEDETSVLTTYREFFLQISFSEVHPLMVFYLGRPLEGKTLKMKGGTNRINMATVLGCHFVDEDAGFYTYRATHWLEAEMSKARFLEILNRCVDEAERGFCQLVS